jgi:hypothetical protein
MAEEGLDAVSLPVGQLFAVVARPGRDVAHVRKLQRREARAGGDVDVTIAVQVPRRAEAEPQLAVLGFPGDVQDQLQRQRLRDALLLATRRHIERPQAAFPASLAFTDTTANEEGREHHTGT